MRLIDTQTLQLREFPDSNIPQYAILSHMWSFEEIMFHDFQQPKIARTKGGWYKIEASARQACRDGLNYLWIDACCTDPSSSTEVVEAMDSMYRWFQISTICYVYLADVVAGPDAEDQFLNSRWHTRSWTLQEMIAPFNVSFFDHNWEHLGNKTTLSKALHQATGVPLDLLLGLKRLDDFSVAEKLSWASERQSIRIEDSAYSLMGIFDVKMPMLYGEGKEAFLRLQEEIIRTTEDPSIFDWRRDGEALSHSQRLKIIEHGLRKDIRRLLAPSPAHFAGYNLKNGDHVIGSKTDDFSQMPSVVIDDSGRRDTILSTVSYEGDETESLAPSLTFSGSTFADNEASTSTGMLVHKIILILVGDSKFKLLAENASAIMARSKVQRNLQILFERYAKDLWQSAESRLEFAAAKMVKDRAVEIAFALGGELDTVRRSQIPAYESLKEAIVDQELKIQAWQDSATIHEHDEPVKEPFEMLAWELSAAEEEAFANFEALKPFLFEGRPYEQLKELFEQWLSLSSKSTSAQNKDKKGSPILMPDLQTSVLDKTGPSEAMTGHWKLSVERIFGKRILWWPLEELDRVPMSEHVTSFACECGTVFKVEATEMGNREGPDKGIDNPGIVKSNGEQQKHPQSTGNSGGSLTRSAATQATDNAQQSQESNNDLGSGTKHSLTEADSCSGPAETQAAKDIEKYFHICVNDRPNSTRLFELDASETKSDEQDAGKTEFGEQDFVSKFIALFLSATWYRNFWVLSELSEVQPVQFERISDNRDQIACYKRALPADKDHEYEFIRGTSRPVLERLVTHILLEHGRPHQLTPIPFLGSLWHFIFQRAKHHDKYLHRIPKKVPRKMSSLAGEKGYGMQAFSAPALWRIVSAFLLYVVGGGLWYLIFSLQRDSKDIQDAFTPLASAIALFVAHLEIVRIAT